MNLINQYREFFYKWHDDPLRNYKILRVWPMVRLFTYYVCFYLRCDIFPDAHDASEKRLASHRGLETAY